MRRSISSRVSSLLITPTRRCWSMPSPRKSSPMANETASSIAMVDLPTPGAAAVIVTCPRIMRNGTTNSRGARSRGARMPSGRSAKGRFAVPCARCAISRSLSASLPSISSQSLTSPLSGNPSSGTIVTVFATGISCSRTASACLRPGSSLSGRMKTSRFAKYLFSAASQLLAPPLLHVANNPHAASRSASFSPSVIKTGSSS